MESQEIRLPGKIGLFPLLMYSFGYQKPHGFLKNKHMISIGAHFLQDSWDTKYDFGPPRGLFVLIMMAVSFIGYIRYSLHVEVHYSMKGLPVPTRLGVYAHPGDFCAKSCNSWVKVYNNNFAEKSDEWWESLLNHYDVAKSEPEKVGDKSILDEMRGALPMSSSP